MQKNDYEAVAKIIEEVMGKDTLTCIKLLEGIKFYFDKKNEGFKVIRSDDTKVSSGSYKLKSWKKDADEAMKRYTNTLRKDAKRFKEENCSITG